MIEQWMTPVAVFLLAGLVGFWVVSRIFTAQKKSLPNEELDVNPVAKTRKENQNEPLSTVPITPDDLHIERQQDGVTKRMPEPKVGDAVIWTSGGVEFGPLKVTGIIEGHITVEGSKTGIPIKAVKIVGYPRSKIWKRIERRSSQLLDHTGQKDTILHAVNDFLVGGAKGREGTG
jgi:hypothetical protein